MKLNSIFWTVILLTLTHTAVFFYGQHLAESKSPEETQHIEAKAEAGSKASESTESTNSTSLIGKGLEFYPNGALKSAAELDMKSLEIEKTNRELEEFIRKSMSQTTTQAAKKKHLITGWATFRNEDLLKFNFKPVGYGGLYQHRVGELFGGDVFAGAGYEKKEIGDETKVATSWLF